MVPTVVFIERDDAFKEFYSPARVESPLRVQVHQHCARLGRRHSSVRVRLRVVGWERSAAVPSCSDQLCRPCIRRQDQCWCRWVRTTESATPQARCALGELRWLSIPAMIANDGGITQRLRAPP
jgi:hypothetical protein